MKLLLAIIIASFVTFPRVLPQDECEVCKKNESPRLWFFTCSEGCTTECVYLVVNDTSEFVVLSEIIPVLASDQQQCSGNGFCINGTCSDEVKGQLEILLDRVHVKLDNLTSDVDLKIYLRVTVNNHNETSKKLRITESPATDHFYDHLKFPNVSITDEINIFVMVKESSRVFPKVYRNINTNVLRIKEQNLLNQYKDYEFMNKWSRAEISIGWNKN